MITMIVDTLPVFYYEKMVGYMPSSFANLVFVGERIEVGLRRGKFDCAASASTSNRRFRAGGAKKKEGDTHAVNLTPTWPKSQQTPHNPTYQYSPHQPSYSANVGNPPNLVPVQQRLPTQPQRPSGVARCTQRYCWCTQHHLKMLEMPLQCFVVRIKLIRKRTMDQLDPQKSNADQVNPLRIKLIRVRMVDQTRIKLIRESSTDLLDPQVLHGST